MARVLPGPAKDPLSPAEPLRRPRPLLALLASLALFHGAAFAEKGEKKKKDPAETLAKAQELYGAGKHKKAVATFELAIDQSEEVCLDCLVGLFRVAVARGSFENAVQYSGAALDAAESSAEDDGKALAAEVEGAYRQALAETGGADPDVIWGLLDVLSRLGRSAEIAGLAARHLGDEDKKTLICAADTRASLARREILPVAEEVNRELRAAGWDGPLLAASDMRSPKLRNRSYSEGKGARMSGVVDARGFLKDVRVVRPPPGKITMDVEDRLRRAFFDPATYRGRRVEVCYPFSVTLPGQINLAQQGGAADGSEAGGSALYLLIKGFESADAILELVEKAGDQISLPQRAAICAAREWHDELNRRLAQLDWPGPYFDTEAVEDPVPQNRQPAEYTDEARAAEVEGEVVLSTVISETGKVVHTEVLEPLPEGLSERAREAVSLWTFEPAELDGEKIAVCRKIVVTFKL